MMLATTMIPDSIPKLAGQALVAGFPAGPLPGELSEAARRGELGGFILFKRNLPDAPAAAELTATLASACPAQLPPFVGLDQEGGRVSRLGPPLLQLPAMGTLGAVDRPQLTRRCAEILGAQLAALGFTIDFAPVLDVDTNPDNPVIGDRSFGRTPEAVVRHAGAFAGGLLASGVTPCGKHFPGHGDTELDSHLALPRVRHDRARLQQVELAPFAALAGQLPALMSAHIVFDALDGERPATLSRAVISGVLRDELGYDGVVFTDDLEMGAIADHHGVDEAACEAVAAGCDAVLICATPERTLAAHAALCRRAEADSTFRERLREAATRTLALRRARRPRAPTPDQVEAQLRALAPGAMEEQLAAALAETNPAGR